MASQIDKDIFEILSQYGVLKKIETGKILQYQDEDVKNIFFIVDGVAAAHVAEINGKEVCLDSYSAGDLIGLEYIRTNNPSISQVSAISDLRVLQFRKQMFAELSDQNVAIGLYLIDKLSARLHKFQQEQIESHVLSKRGRVALEIRCLASPTQETDQSYIVSPKPVISEIAFRLGIARETVSRTINDLIKNQVIQRNRNAFYVPDLSVLEAEMR